MKIDWKKRVTNYGFWITLSSLVLLSLPTLGVEVDYGKYDDIVKHFLQLLVMLGIINNPTTDNSGFGDDKTEE